MRNITVCDIISIRRIILFYAYTSEYISCAVHAWTPSIVVIVTIIIIIRTAETVSSPPYGFVS